MMLVARTLRQKIKGKRKLLEERKKGTIIPTLNHYPRNW